MNHILVPTIKVIAISYTSRRMKNTMVVIFFFAPIIFDADPYSVGKTNHKILNRVPCMYSTRTGLLSLNINLSSPNKTQ